MANKMLIDASHPEETRVVVLRGNRVEEFDFESASKKPLRGNIYLAKVMRVEPSLQAAFVDYGGNRHGFLAFSEIHPDYYQIPVADRQLLIEEEAKAHRDEEEELTRQPRRSRRHRRSNPNGNHGAQNNGQWAEKRRGADATLSAPYARQAAAESEGELSSALAETAEDHVNERETPRDESQALPEEIDRDAEAGPVTGPDFDTPAQASGADAPPPAEAAPGPHTGTATDPGLSNAPDEAHDTERAREAEPFAAISQGEPLPQPQEARERGIEEGEDGEEEATEIEHLGGGDALEEMPARPPRPRRQYKIQEVIKRRQVLLVQVVKEERGNKGAALTTYLSLAGRYSVLMPNTARGGGVSRKITDAADRQRLKAIAQELEVPEGMGVIVRTAGASRTKAEVKRDFEYLLRMWETVRETTLRSSAPKLVYEEGSLIKRAIRDLYNKDIDEIVVAGDDGYREAKEFMRLLMPSHAKMVQPYREPQPMFAKYGVEPQLDAMFSNQVTLKSGGYIVINQAEALVAIDVNSGRSTREHNIEDTALRTNLEAAEEIARQLRLRDLAGLIVIDFIDMEESRNNRLVERRLKDALKNDRARIQIGRMSHFGLLEMSRQRIRTGVLEGSTIVCPHCGGGGVVRSTASIALHVLRALEDALMKSADYDLIIKARTPVGLYILNQKRSHLRDLEKRYGVSLTIEVDDSLSSATHYSLQKGEPAAGLREALPPAVQEAPSLAPAEESLTEVNGEFEPEEAMPAEVAAEAQSGGKELGEGESEPHGRQRRRRRRRRGRGLERETSGIAASAPQPPDDALQALAELGSIRPLPFALHEAGPSHGPELAREERTESLPGSRAQPFAGETPIEGEPSRPASGEPSPPMELAAEAAESVAEAATTAEEVPAAGKKPRSRRAPRAVGGRSRAKSATRAAEAAPPAEPHEGGGAEPVAAAAGSAHEPVAAETAGEMLPPLAGETERESESGAPLLSGITADAGTEDQPAPPDESEEEQAGIPARPKRTGWWQRTRAGR